MKRWTRILALSMAALLALGMAGCGPKLDEKKPSGGERQGRAEAKPDIVIGLAISLTGGTASYGVAAKRGVELAVEDFNQSGGYNGQKVKLVAYDDEAKPDKSVEVIQRLISQDKMVALIGPANSGNALAHIDIVQKAEIPEVVPVATSTPITQKFAKEPKNYIFRVSMVDSAQVSTMVRWIQKKGFKKVGLLHDTSGFGQAGLKDVKEQTAAAGIKLTEIASFQVGDSNLEPQLTKMKNAGVDVIIGYALAAEVAQILKAADKINYQPAFVNTWGTSDPVVKKLAGDLVNKGNVHMIQSFTIDQSPEATAFHERLIRVYSEDLFPIASAQAYDSAQLILQAIKKVGPDSRKIRDAIENMSDFKGITAAPARPFTKENHEAIGSEHMFVGVYQKGDIVRAK